MNSLEEIKIRKELQKVLLDTPNDYKRILELSNQLAANDVEHVRFSVDSGIINRLGNELVGKRETAVGELIKNAYDADATKVDLIFEQAWTPGGTLRIEDTGNGMTREQLINGFMRLSSASKVNEPYSPIFHRARAGKKGIGRFAAQRLGNKLTIITQTKNTPYAIKVSFEWKRFVTDTDLWSVESRIEEIPKIKDQGTDLIIEDLREGWTDALLAKTNKSVMALLQPYPIGKDEKNLIDPGVQINFYRDQVSEEHKVIDSVESIYNLALVEIDGLVKDDGEASWSMKSTRLGDEVHFHSNSNDKKNYPLLKGMKLKAYYYIYESSLFPRGAMKYVRDLASEYGGIRVYRNGFRVLPYGEKGNDWLGLDESVTKRTILSPHQNSNFFGLVELKGDYLLHEFEETASREGLIENEAYNELVECIYQMLMAVVLRVSDLRGRKGRADQKGWDKNPTIKVDTALDELRSIFVSNPEKEKKSSEQSRTSGRQEFYNQAKSLIEEIHSKRQEERKIIAALLDENRMLRVLASVGLIVGEFVHEVKRFLPAFRSSIDTIKTTAKDNLLIDENIVNLEYQIEGFTSYTSYFESNISQNIIRELTPIAPHKQVKDFINIVSNDLKRAGIVMEPPVLKGINLRTMPMHPSEWMSILFNLYTNSKKAIYKANKIDRRIFISVTEDSKNVILEFSDTGVGIPEKDRENVFDAFFTTSNPVNTNQSQQDLSGSGLGLTIVRDIIESYGGNIMVTTPQKGYMTTIRLTIPKSE